MGSEHSQLKKEGYKISKKEKNHLIVTKGNDSFFVKRIHLEQLPKQTISKLSSEIEFFKTTVHPHIVNMKNTFEVENPSAYYVVMDHCTGGNLADEIKKTEPLEEAKVLSWITDLCVALKVIHEAALHHKNLTPKNIFFTELGLLNIAGAGNLYENLKSESNSNEILNYLAPEVFTEGTYDAKSDIWSVGCLLFELCTKEQAFSAKTANSLIPKIIKGDSPTLPRDKFSPEFNNLLRDLLTKDPQERPTASEVLAHPIVIKCLANKSKTTMDELDTKLKQLKALADGLERIHEGTTIGSLTGGVIGAVGGITSIVGLVLSPFTLGASLIVTGVGVGVGALGGVTAGASNVTNVVNQSIDRKAVHLIIKEFEQKINAMVTWLLEISTSLQTISHQCPQTEETDNSLNKSKLTRLGLCAGKGLGGVSELVRLARVLTIGKIAAQTSKVVRAAQIVTGVLSGIFVIVDVICIGIDAKEIHNIKQARETERSALSLNSEFETSDIVSSPDQTPLQSSSLMQESKTEKVPEAQDKSATDKREKAKFEIMKFIQSVRQSADDLEKVMNELKAMISCTPLFQEDNDVGWQNMMVM